MRWRRLLGVTGFCISMSCSGGSQPAQEPTEPVPAEPAKTPPPAPEASEPPAQADEPAEPEAPEQAEAAPVPERRNVVYRVTPQGLIIEVDGARFTPKAEAKKLKGGAFGVELTVAAEALDDRTHTLLSPEHGPLSMAAVIYDKKGNEQARHGDHRQGSDLEFLMPGGALTLSRSWPSGNVKGPLWWGQTVHLEVGLWGLGSDDKEGRPVRKLFVVEMVAGNKPRAVITPPNVSKK